MSQVTHPVRSFDIDCRTDIAAGKHSPWRTTLLVSLGVFCASLAVLWWNTAPTVTFHDSSEFAIAAASAGIPHPPGAPTWTILATLFVKLGGFSDAARGTNLFSAFCGALTLALMSWLVRIWTYRLFRPTNALVPIVASITAPLVLVHSQAFLEQATTTEQYTLLTALLAGMLIVATTIMNGPKVHAETGHRMRPFLLLGLLFGLAIGNHLSQAVLGLLVVWVVWLKCKHCRNIGDSLCIVLTTFAGLMIGLLVFLWLPIRSRADPMIDWGNVETWERFVWAVGREQWISRPISETPPGFILEWVRTYDLIGELGILGFVLMAVGVIALVKNKMWLGWLAAITVPYAVGMIVGHMKQKGMDISYIRGYGVADWHIPIYMVLAIIAAVGMGAVTTALDRTRRLRPILLFGFIACLSISAARQTDRYSLRNFTAPDDFLLALTTPLPEGAIVLPSEDNVAGILTYEDCISNPDNKRWVSWRIEPLTMAMEPGRREWSDESKVRYITQINMNPDKQPFSVRHIDPEYARKGRLFVAFVPKFVQDAQYLLPAGLLFEVTGRPTSDEEVRKAEQEWRRKYPGVLRNPSPGSHRLERHAWAVVYRERGTFFAQRGLWPEAIDNYARSVEWLSNDGQVWFLLAYAQECNGDIDAAVKYYRHILDICPYITGVRENLAIIYAQAGRLDEAEKLLLAELKLKPTRSAKHNLDLVRSSMGRRSIQDLE